MEETLSAPWVVVGYDYQRIERTEIPLQIRRPATGIDLDSFL